MIREGKNGSLNLFYKELLIGSYPLTDKKTYERYKYQGEYLILTSMRENIKIPFQIKTYILFCNSILRRKENKLNIWRSDYEMFLSCIFALIKLKILDEDDSVLIVGKKKKKKKTQASGSGSGSGIIQS